MTYYMKVVRCRSGQLVSTSQTINIKMKSAAVAILFLIFYYGADFANSCLNDCAAVDCISQQDFVNSCLEKNEAYVFPNGCDCCGHCAPVKEVIDPKLTTGCDPTICPVVRCYPQNITECTSNQIYVPSDGLCFCCPQCADRRRKRC